VNAQSYKGQSLYVQACGMVTPVGLNLLSSASAIRAGISSFEESSIYNKRFSPISISLVNEEYLPEISEGVVSIIETGLTTRQIRLIKLASMALDDLASQVSIDNLPIFLAASENHPKIEHQACHPELIQQLELQLDLRFHPDQVHLYPFGRAAGVQALSEAMLYLQQSDSDLAIVGGVDSGLDLMLIGTLDQEDRILAENVADGFTPGEAASFLLLSKNPVGFNECNKKIKIYSSGLAEEPGHRFSEKPYQGDGLAKAFSIALHNANIQPINTIFSSLNGENFGSKEYGVANIRNQNAIHPDCDIEHPADCFGDIGAAIFPVMLGLTAMGLVNNYIQEPVLCYASSEAEMRGAACIASECG